MERKHHKKHHEPEHAEQAAKAEVTPEVVAEAAEPAADHAAELAEANDKYLRLYADFDNFRKKVMKDKEELAKVCKRVAAL